MISGRQMQELLELAETKSARIAFNGDSNQIQSVEACDALRMLEKESGLKSFSCLRGGFSSPGHPAGDSALRNINSEF
jgi:hypothetical protein